MLGWFSFYKWAMNDQIIWMIVFCIRIFLNFLACLLVASRIGCDKTFLRFLYALSLFLICSGLSGIAEFTTSFLVVYALYVELKGVSYFTSQANLDTYWEIIKPFWVLFLLPFVSLPTGVTLYRWAVRILARQQSQSPIKSPQP
jgi:hypothetical protein